jgi:acyl dehydratase
VQGGVTSGLLNAVVAEQLPGPGSVFLHVDWSFTAPVRPGDEITAEVEVLSARGDKPITELRTTVIRQDGVVALEGTATVWCEPIRQSVTYRGGVLVLPGAPGIPLCEHASPPGTWTRRRR